MVFDVGTNKTRKKIEVNRTDEVDDQATASAACVCCNSGGCLSGPFAFAMSLLIGMPVAAWYGLGSVSASLGATESRMWTELQIGGRDEGRHHGQRCVRLLSALRLVEAFFWMRCHYMVHCQRDEVVNRGAWPTPRLKMECQLATFRVAHHMTRFLLFRGQRNAIMDRVQINGGGEGVVDVDRVAHRWPR